MATRSFNEKIVIDDEQTLERLNKALNKPSQFEHIKPIFDEEAARCEKLGRELFNKWSSSR